MTARPTEPAVDESGESTPSAETVGGADRWAKAVVDGMPDEPDAQPDAERDAQLDAEPDAQLDAEPGAQLDAEPGAERDAEREPVDDRGDDPVGDPGDPPAGGAGSEQESGPTGSGSDAGPTGSDAGPTGSGPTGSEISVEDLVIDLERVTVERDQYLDASRRLQAEFENYKKQVGKRESEARERANDSLIGELLPILDAFDGALANGATDVEPMRASFLETLEKQGLERIDPNDEPFDPTVHEAVMHEDDDDTDGPVVAEVMRAGYAWKGRVLRPAMVRTRG